MKHPAALLRMKNETPGGVAVQRRQDDPTGRDPTGHRYDTRIGVVSDTPEGVVQESVFSGEKKVDKKRPV